PDCQRSWKETGRFCSREYSSARIWNSTSVAGVRTNQRRSHTMAASPSASASTPKAPAKTNPREPALASRLKFFTICSSTIGIIRAMTAAPSALSAPPMRRPKIGRMNGFNRHRAANVDRDDEEDVTDMALSCVAIGDEVGADAKTSDVRGGRAAAYAAPRSAAQAECARTEGDERRDSHRGHGVLLRLGVVGRSARQPSSLFPTVDRTQGVNPFRFGSIPGPER